MIHIPNKPITKQQNQQITNLINKLLKLYNKQPNKYKQQIQQLKQQQFLININTIK